MSNNSSNSTEIGQINPTSLTANANIPSISVDLTWIDMLKGIAIIGVFFDNWTGYMSFPVLIKILKKWGPWVLLLISAFVTYATLAIAVLAGASGSHAADLFTFWMIQFALGMVLAYVRETAPQELCHLIGPKAFFLGIGLMMCSWALRTYVPLGKTFNDSVTSVGIFLILLNLGWTSRAKIPVTGKVLNTLSSKSYLMYLVHYPIMTFLIGPPLRVPTNPIIVIALGGIYIIIVFFLCHFISQPIDKFTSWAYKYRTN